jgi:hypothetical protein
MNSNPTNTPQKVCAPLHKANIKTDGINLNSRTKEAPEVEKMLGKVKSNEFIRGTKNLMPRGSKGSSFQNTQNRRRWMSLMRTTKVAYTHML